jgi:hypothetical protein
MVCGSEVKRFIVFTLFILPLAFPLSSPGVSFDFWETGMTINEVVSTAQKHDVPIARSGIVHGYSKFERKLLDDKFFTAPVLEYKTKVGNNGAILYLRLSDKPKQVYEIEVAIVGLKNAEEFMREMIGILKQKYGPFTERKEVFFHYFEWKEDANSQITLRKSSIEVHVFYTDPKMKEIVEARRKEKELGSVRKDGKQF